MIKTTVGYAARELGISRQLVHIYIKKGLIRAERSGPARTAPYWLEDEDVKQLLGSMKLVFAHEQRARLLGKKKKRKAEAAGTADVSAATISAESAAGTAEAVEVPLGSSEAAESQPEAATGTATEGTADVSEGAATVSNPVAALAASYGVRL